MRSLAGMRRIAGIWAALAVIVALFAATGAPGASARQCEAGFTEARAPGALDVRGDTCAHGRKVAIRVAAVAPSGCVKASGKSRKLTFRRPCVRLGYGCVATTLNGGKRLRVSCTSGAARIRFSY